MRLWILSDLHVDANGDAPFTLPEPRPRHDVVVIAGDLCEGIARGLHWIETERLNAAPVIYVPGNHEFYGTSIARGLAAGRAAVQGLKNVHVLDCESIEIGGVRFSGATLWTDFRVYGEVLRLRSMQVAARSMRDYQRIDGETSGRFTPLEAIAAHEAARAFLEAEAERGGGRLGVVVTHTAPSLKSIADPYRDNLMTAAFASNLESLVAKADAWVHGHTHIGCDYMLSGCRVINNPRGYVAYGEGAGFDAGLVVEIDL